MNPVRDIKQINSSSTVSNGVNLLAIDASSENISLCVKYKEKIFQLNQRRHFGASRLIADIASQLKKNSSPLESMDAFVIGSGPGSFTGLRISFSLIKAFMLALNKPAIMVGSFFSCAQILKGTSERIAVIADARRSLIYGACFRVKKGLLKEEGRERLYQLEEFTRHKNDYLFVSYDAQLREKALKLNPKINFYPKDVYPSAKYLLPQAQLCYNKGKFTAVEELKPLYLHPKTCQIRKTL